MTNQQFAQEIDELYAKAKRGELEDRQARMDEIEDLTERYFSVNGRWPPYTMIDRLSTLCLREEYIDPHPDKMTREEYPILTESQRDERERTEISGTWAEEVGIDKRDYRPKTRDTMRKMREISGDY